MEQNTEHSQSDEHIHHHHHHHHHHSSGSGIRRHKHSHFHPWITAQRVLSKFFHKLQHAPMAVVLLMVGIMPIIYMGGDAWWLPLMAILGVGALVCWMLAGWWCGSEAGKPRFGLGALLFLVPALFGFIQMIPWNMLVKVFSPSAWKTWSAFNELGVGVVKASLSMSPDATAKYCMFYLIAFLVYFLVASQCHHRFQIKLVLLALVVAALGNAIISYYVFFAGKTGMDNITSFSGSFLNRNHFGFLMIGGIMACFSLLSMISAEDKKSKDDWNGWTTLVVPIGIVVFMLLTALVLSLSRGAFVGAVVAFFMFGIIWLKKSHEIKRSDRQKVLALLVMIAVAFLLAMPYAMSSLSQRFNDVVGGDISFGTRMEIWKDALRLIKDYKLAGVGLGGFGNSIQPYDKGAISYGLIGHAHNDYLEFMAEVGIPISFLLGLLALFIWLRSFRRSFKIKDNTFKWAQFGCSCVLVGFAVHEFVEFNLHAYPNMVMFAVYLAIVEICSGKYRHGSEKEKRRSELRKENRVARFKWRLALIPAALVVAAMLPFCLNSFKKAYTYSQLVREVDGGELQFAPRKYDFERRLGYAAKSSTVYAGKHNVLKYMSVSNYGYSRLNNISRSKRNEYLKKACDEIIASCMRAPGNGETAMLLARTIERANMNAVRHDSPLLMYNLFKWALSRQPYVKDTVNFTAFAAYDFFNMAKAAGDVETEEIRQDTLKYMIRLISLRPDNMRRIYAALPVLLENYEDVIKYLPDTVVTYRELSDFLFEKKQYEVSRTVLQKMLGKLGESYEQYTENGGKLHEDEYAFYLLKAYSGMCAVDEMLELDEERASYWQKMLDMDERFASLASKRKRGKHDDPFPEGYKTEVRLSNSSTYLEEARRYTKQARIDDAVHSLVPLAYVETVKVSTEELKEAISLLSGWDASDEYSTISRANFLQCAFSMLLAERGEVPEFMDYERKLASLEKEMLDDSEKTWLQKHLVPYYRGRLMEKQGKTEEAVVEYRRCLDWCPNNLWAMRRLVACANGGFEYLTDEEKELMEIINSRRTPIACFSNGITWLGMKTDPDSVDSLHATQKHVNIFVCDTGIDAVFNWRMDYLDSKGIAFSDAFAPLAEDVLTLRAGELYVLKRTFQPHVKALQNRHRVIRNGKVYVSVKAASLPSQAIVKAFDVKEEAE